MLRQTRTGCAARFAATLSGAPRVLALHAPVEDRCTCKSDAHRQRECDCAICRRAALSARASDGRLPSCHGAAARKPPPRDATGDSPDVPCVERTCGGEGRPAVTVAGIEPFCPPAQERFAPALSPEARPTSADPVRARSLEPETPPPRAA